MRALGAISVVAWLAAVPLHARAQAEPDGAPLDAPAAPTLEPLEAAFPPLDDAPDVVRSSGWEDRLTLSVGVAAIYELSQWPAAVLFGRSATKTAPGVALLLGVRYGLSRYFELAA